MIYLDDILIYSNNMSKHHQHVKEVLKYLYKTSLYTKAEKYKFYSKLVLNQMLLLDSGMSILKGGILATSQSILTTSNLSSLKNNL